MFFASLFATAGSLAYFEGEGERGAIKSRAVRISRLDVAKSSSLDS